MPRTGYVDSVWTNTLALNQYHIMVFVHQVLQTGLGSVSDSLTKE